VFEVGFPHFVVGPCFVGFRFGGFWVSGVGFVASFCSVVVGCVLGGGCFRRSLIGCVDYLFGGLVCCEFGWLVGFRVAFLGCLFGIWFAVGLRWFDF